MITLCLPKTTRAQSSIFSAFKNPLTLANENYSQGNYANAIELYQSVLAKRPEDISTQLKLAQAYYQVKDYKRSVAFYNSYLGHERDDLSFADMFRYAEAKVVLNDHVTALTYYKKCLQQDPKNDMIAKKIWGINNINYLLEDSSRYAVQEMSINSTYGELAPVPVRDGLVFTSNRRGSQAVERVSARLNEPFYQLYKSSWKVASTTGILIMTEPKHFASSISSPYNTGPLAFYNKGNNMVFVSSSADPDGNGGYTLGLYFAVLEENKWKIVSSYQHNSDDYSINDVSINEDGTVLYFSSEMKGGLGGNDIYTSQLKDGQWSKPLNLGDVVNTSQNEIFPYLHQDGSLYFSSDGLPGLGQLDLFKAETKADGYSEPQNLGYPVNSSYDDFALAFDSLATHGYFASNRKRGGYDDDLYELDMDLQQYPVTITGVMKFKEHTWSEQAAIQPWPNVKFYLIDSKYGKSVFEGVTGADGRFSITIPYFSKYFLQIVDPSGNEHKASLELAKYRSEISSHEIVVVKDIFNQKDVKN
ncbi:MAG TPA: tetratricopeptide repeat protein [Chryseolinea sp.]|nr:tetratricopeptide repeat protein [Chryseolinea sp.]